MDNDSFKRWLTDTVFVLTYDEHGISVTASPAALESCKPDEAEAAFAQVLRRERPDPTTYGVSSSLVRMPRRPREAIVDRRPCRRLRRRFNQDHIDALRIERAQIRI